MLPIGSCREASLQPQGAGVLVRTQESWEGDPVDDQVDALQSALISRCATGWKI